MKKVITKSLITLSAIAVMSLVVQKVAAEETGYKRDNSSTLSTSRSVDIVISASKMGYYNRQTGELNIVDRPDLGYTNREPSSSEFHIEWLCDEDVFCCVDTEQSGCTDFVIGCEASGGQETPINGGQGGTCDCSDTDGNGYPQC